MIFYGTKCRCLLSLMIIALPILLCGMLNQQVAASSQLRPLPIDQALSVSLPVPNSLEVTSDGRYISYMTCNGRRSWQLESHKIANHVVDNGFLGCQLHVLSAFTNANRVIAGDSMSAHDARWSPDGRFLAYLVPIDSSTDQLYIWDRNTNRSRVFPRLRVASNSYYPPVWIPGSDAIIVAIHRNLVSAYHVGSAITESTVTVYRSPKDLETDPWNSAKLQPSAGPWPISGDPVMLMLVNLQTGAMRTLASSIDAAAVNRIYLSPDGRYMVYAAATTFNGPHSQQTLDDVHLLSLSNGKIVTIATGAPMVFGYGISWSPNSRYIAWITSGIDASGKLYIYALQSSKTEIYAYAGKTLFGSHDYSPQSERTAIGEPIWDANSANVYVFDCDHQNAIWKFNLPSRKLNTFFEIPNERLTGIAHPLDSDVVGLGGQRVIIAITQNAITKHTSVYSINFDSRVPKNIWEGSAKLTQLTCSRNCRTLVYFKEQADESPDIWESSADMKQQHRLTDLAPLFDGYTLGRSRVISWRLPNGGTVDGALLMSAGYVSGRRYPLIVFPYPGSYKSNFVNQFAGSEGPADTVVDDLQLLTTRGYTILLPDAPYRTGRKMRDLFDDIMAGVDKAIALGIADPQRLGVMGHSDGGYTVLGLIVQTHRFKAAVSRSGFSDMISEAFQMDDDGSAYSLNIVEGATGDSLWAMPQKWIVNSPVFYFNYMNTPLLITQGGGDIYVQKSAARETFVALRRLNKIVQYAEYGGEGHAESTWSYPNQVDYVTRMIGWFDRFLCPHRVSPVSC